MRQLKQLCASCVLTLSLALSAFAGEMTTGFTAPLLSTDAATEVMLNLAQSILSLF